MSELAPGSLSLEDDQSAQIQPEPEAPAAPVAPPDTPPPVAAAAEDTDPEGTVVNPGGEKLVPLGALAATRQQLRAEKEARERLEAETAAAKQEVEQIRGDWQRVQPLITQLRQPPPPVVPQMDAEAVQYARDLDLYKADGQPDVERARRILDHNARVADDRVRNAVQPLYQQTAQQQSAANFHGALALKDKNGVQVDRGTLERVWSMLPPEMTANPDIARVLYKVAKAEMLDAGLYRTPTQAPAPPVITESLGGNSSPPKELTALDRNMLTAASMKPKDYEAIAATYKPGQTNSLE